MVTDVAQTRQRVTKGQAHTSIDSRLRGNDGQRECPLCFHRSCLWQDAPHRI